jgi:hypothetical protein
MSYRRQAAIARRVLGDVDGAVAYPLPEPADVDPAPEPAAPRVPVFHQGARTRPEARPVDANDAFRAMIRAGWGEG